MITALLAQASDAQTFFGTIGTPQPLVDAGYGTSGGLITFFSNMITVAVVVGGLFTLFNVIQAGYLYLTAGGDSKAHEKVVSKLTMSLWGIVLMIMAPAIMAVIGWVLFKTPSYFLKPQLTGPQQQKQTMQERAQ